VAVAAIDNLPEISANPSTSGLIMWDRPDVGEQGCYNPHTAAAYQDWIKKKPRKEISLPLLDLSGERNNAPGSEEKNTRIVPPKRKQEPDANGSANLNEAENDAWYDWMEFNRQNVAEYIAWLSTIFRQKAPGTPITSIRRDPDWGRLSGYFSNGEVFKSRDGLVVRESASSEDLYGLFQEIKTPFQALSNGEWHLHRSAGMPIINMGSRFDPSLSSADRRLCYWSLIAAGQKGLLLSSYDELHKGSLEAKENLKEFFEQVGSKTSVFSSPRLPARIAILDTVGLRTVESAGAHYDAYRLLRERGYLPDIVPLDRLSLEALRRYGLLVVPSFSAVPEEAQIVIEKFVEGEGRIMAFANSFITPNDERTLANPPAFLGVSRTPALPSRKRIEIIAETKDVIIGRGAEDIETYGETVAVFEDALPAAAMTDGGRILYCAFQSEYDPALSGLLQSLMTQMGFSPAVRTVNRDTREAAQGVISSLLAQGELRFVMLINPTVKEESLTVSVESKHGSVFDILKSVALESFETADGRRQVDVDIPSGDVSVLAFAPELRRMKLDAPGSVRSGGKVPIIRAEMDSDDVRPVTLDFIDPEGQVREEYRVQNYASNGSLKTMWALPWNVQEGIWKVRLTDQITGREIQESIKVHQSRSAKSSISKITLRAK